MFVTFFYCDVFVSMPMLESPIVVVGHFKSILFTKKNWHRKEIKCLHFRLKLQLH
jgi:hypothetical protein